MERMGDEDGMGKKMDGRKEGDGWRGRKRWREGGEGDGGNGRKRWREGEEMDGEGEAERVKNRIVCFERKNRTPTHVRMYICMHVKKNCVCYLYFNNRLYLFSFLD